MTADVATKILAPIMGGFAMLGVLVSCPNDPIPSLCSRPAFEKVGVPLSQREIRKWAPSSARTCDVSLEQRSHVLFGEAKVQTSTV